MRSLLQVDTLISELQDVYSCAMTTYNATSELIALASALGVSNRAAASQLLSAATAEAQQAQQYRDVSFGTPNICMDTNLSVNKYDKVRSTLKGTGQTSIPSKF